MNSALGRLALVLFCLAATITKAQVYQLKSLDGRSVQLRLFYKPFSHKLAICYLRDTLYLPEYIGHKARVLNNHFLEVVYAQRGGSNVGCGSTVLVGISRNKLVQALHIDSFNEYDMRNIYKNPGTLGEYKLYTATLTAQADNKLLVGVHDEHSTEQTPTLNHNFNRSFTLLFDPAKHIFYNCTKRITGQLVSYQKDASLPLKKKFSGSAPAVQLGKDAYVFVDEAWYWYSRKEGSPQNTYYRVD